jgi:hypothetical protein
MTFGRWLQTARFKQEPESGFRDSTLGIPPDDLAEFLAMDFSDPRALLDWLLANFSPASGPVEGAMRCWVKWRETEWRYIWKGFLEPKQAPAKITTIDSPQEPSH